jgi:hypothetical protein
MPFSAVTNVTLGGRDRADADKFLQDVIIPRVKELPGFQTARFLRSTDGATGVGAVMFDTESHARAGLDALMKDRPADAPKVESTAIYELIVEI